MEICIYCGETNCNCLVPVSDLDLSNKCTLCGEDRDTTCECGETAEMDAHWHQYDEMKKQHEREEDEFEENIDNL